MTWFSGQVHSVLEVNAPLDETIEFFSNPATFQVALPSIETAEKIEDHVWRWTLVAKKEKGITFQGVYEVEYTRKDDGVVWRTREGNMDSSGVAKIYEKNGAVVIDYDETIKLDLPVPKLLAPVMKKIVAKEIEAGIRDFIQNSIQKLES